MVEGPVSRGTCRLATDDEVEFFGIEVSQLCKYPG
jgi:hypothetical protein